MEDKERNSGSHGIIVFDQISVVRSKINRVFDGLNIQIYGASNEIELYNILQDKDMKVSLIIMDIGYDANKGFEILSKIKEKNQEVPVLILTSNNKRQTFIRGIVEGASDYILKPFEDNYFLKKVLILLDKKTQKNTLQMASKDEIVFNILSYLNTEFKKAQKGTYEITILMITFFMPVDEVSAEIENQYVQVSDLFYQKFNSVMWKTDTLMPYGSQTFIGVFPYCDLNNKDTVKKRVMDSFLELKAEKDLVAPYYLAVSSLTYPSEAEDAKKLVLSLGMLMKEEIEEIKRVNIVDLKSE